MSENLSSNNVDIESYRPTASEQAVYINTSELDLPGVGFESEETHGTVKLTPTGVLLVDVQFNTIQIEIQMQLVYSPRIDKVDIYLTCRPGIILEQHITRDAVLLLGERYILPVIEFSGLAKLAEQLSVAYVTLSN